MKIVTPPKRCPRCREVILCLGYREAPQTSQVAAQKHDLFPEVLLWSEISCFDLLM